MENQDALKNALDRLKAKPQPAPESSTAPETGPQTTASPEVEPWVIPDWMREHLLRASGGKG
jgi:hypothetical protein